MTLANWSLSRPSAWLDSMELPSAEQLMRLHQTRPRTPDLAPLDERLMTLDSLHKAKFAEVRASNNILIR